MTLEEQLQQLSQQACPCQVDVVDAVMAHARQHPYLITRKASSARKTFRFAPIAYSSAAAVLILFVVNFTLFRPRTYNDDSISSMLAYVSDYDYYAPVESAALDPHTYLYDEYSEN